MRVRIYQRVPWSESMARLRELWTPPVGVPSKVLSTGRKLSKSTVREIALSPVTSKCTTCDHFKVHHLGWVFSDGLRGWLARS